MGVSLLVNTVTVTDPQRLGSLRQKFLARMRAEFAIVQKELWRVVVKEDGFGLLPNSIPVGHSWGSLPVHQQVQEFDNWLKEKFSQLVAHRNPLTGLTWVEDFGQKAYEAGVKRSYADYNSLFSASNPEEFLSSQNQFMRMATLSPQGLGKKKLVTERASQQLRGTLWAIRQSCNLVLSRGLSQGVSPLTLGRGLVNAFKGTSLVRNTLLTNAKKKKKKGTDARLSRLVTSEVTHAHASGQLDAMQLLGLKKVGIAAEWVTAENPCPECEENSGQIFSLDQAYGVLPLHPNCKCAWVAVFKKSGRWVAAKSFHNKVKRLPVATKVRRRTR